MTDWAQLYTDGVESLAKLGKRLDTDDLTVRVPATPGWTVQQVLAHVAGTASDAVSGRMEDAPSPEWTARHVAEREGASVKQLIAEVVDTQEAVIATLADDDSPAVVWNLAVHLADLKEALGLSRPPVRTWGAIVEHLRGRIPPVLADADEYELFRVLFSRRSRKQVAALAGASEQVLAAVGLFGPRDDDQPRARAKS